MEIRNLRSWYHNVHVKVCRRDGSLERVAALGGLAIGHENHPMLPIEILYAHTVGFTLVSHSRVAHQYRRTPVCSCPRVSVRSKNARIIFG